MFHLLYVRSEVEVFQCDIFSGLITSWHCQDKVIPFCTLRLFLDVWLCTNLRIVMEKNTSLTILQLCPVLLHTHISHRIVQSLVMGMVLGMLRVKFSIVQLLLPVLLSEDRNIRHHKKVEIFINYWNAFNIF